MEANRSASPPTKVAKHRASVLVQREMEGRRAPLASIAPIPPGEFATAESGERPAEGVATETATGFKKESGWLGINPDRIRGRELLALLQAQNGVAAMNTRLAFVSCGRHTMLAI